MEPRPLGDRVAGIDDVVVAHGAALAVEASVLVELRCVLADVVRRHGEVLDFFFDGGQEALVVATGLVTSWPDPPLGSSHVVDGVPRNGVELVPVAAASLAEVCGQDPERHGLVAAAAGQLACVLVDDDKVFAVGVCREFCDAVVCAHLTSQLDA